MTGTLTSAENSSRSDDDMIDGVKTKISDVIGGLSNITQTLGQHSAKLESSGASIRDKISSLLVDLQFQDRIDQILSSLVSDMNKLNNEVSSGGNNGLLQLNQQRSLDSWFNELESSYNMVQQKNIQRGETSKSDAEDEIDFF